MRLINVYCGGLKSALLCKEDRGVTPMMISEIRKKRKKKKDRNNIALHGNRMESQCIFFYRISMKK